MSGRDVLGMRAANIEETRLASLIERRRISPVFISPFYQAMRLTLTTGCGARKIPGSR